MKFQRRYSHEVHRQATSVLCHQTSMLTGYQSAKDYPQALRRVVVRDEAGERITFQTNNFAVTPRLIADLYRQRWQVEQFFN